MPQIRIREEEFPHDPEDLEAADEPNVVGQPFDMDFTREELLHAAWTSGHEQAFFEQQGMDAMHHYCQWKRSVVEMCIREVMDGNVPRWGATQMLGAMDPSERQGASYHLGLMMTTAWARRRHNIPWLLHLDLYREEHNVIMQNDAGRSRPDLIGHDDQGQWAVFEAKGRKGSPSTDSKKDAKRQAMRVQTVGGVNPAHRLAVFAHFGPEPDNVEGRCHLQCLVIDPPGDPKHPKPINFNFVNKENFFRRYYQPWMGMLGKASDSQDDQGMLWSPLRSLKLEFGILAELASALQKQDWEKAPEVVKMAQDRTQFSNSLGYWAGDGIAIRRI